MGFADVCVFCWRERPWHHIPDSDGTFFGSFCHWRFHHGEQSWFRRASEAPKSMPGTTSEKPTTSQTGLLSSLKRWSMSRKSSRSPRASASIESGHARLVLGHRRAFSGGSDKRSREAELAYERLALERADFEKQQPSLNGRRQSVMSQMQQQQRSPVKDWWDAEIDTGKGGG